jgi:hypothetical protein
MHRKVEGFSVNFDRVYLKTACMFTVFFLPKSYYLSKELEKLKCVHCCPKVRRGEDE